MARALLALAVAVAAALSAVARAECDPATPLANVTWQQISGTWYLIESTSSAGIAQDVCYGIILGPNYKSGFEKRGDEQPSYVNTTLITNSTSSWFERESGYHTRVAFFSEERASLALVSCVPILDERFQWVGVFGRGPAADQEALDGVYAHLAAANVSGIESPRRYSNDACGSLHSA